MSETKNNNINSSFQTFLDAEKKRSIRVMALLGSLLFISFAIVDLLSVTASLFEVLFIRGFVVITLLLAFAATHTEFFYKYYNFTVICVYLVTTTGIEAMIYIALPDDHASKVYFAGLILIIMTIYTWAYFELKVSIFVTTVIVGSYSYLELFLMDSSLSVIIANIFFLLGASAIGVTSQLMRDKYIRENFMLQQSLKEALQEKTTEAKDNEYLANHDSLTGLPNRRFITQLLTDSLEAAKRQDRVMVFLFIDLNGFKQINDHYGHYAGDEVLKIVAKRLELGIRKGDNLSRLGGDEYLIGLLMEKENISEIEAMASKFSALVEQPMNIAGTSIKVSCSIGIAAYPMHGHDVNVLIDIADKKMYQTKNDIQQRQYIDDNDKSVVDFQQASKLRSPN